MTSYSHGFATALFSFLYHLASYEAGNKRCLNNLQQVYKCQVSSTLIFTDLIQLNEAYRLDAT